MCLLLLIPTPLFTSVPSNSFCGFSRSPFCFSLPRNPGWIITAKRDIGGICVVPFLGGRTGGSPGRPLGIQSHVETGGGRLVGWRNPHRGGPPTGDVPDHCPSHSQKCYPIALRWSKRAEMASVQQNTTRCSVI